MGWGGVGGGAFPLVVMGGGRGCRTYTENTQYVYMFYLSPDDIKSDMNDFLLIIFHSCLF